MSLILDEDQMCHREISIICILGSGRIEQKRRLGVIWAYGENGGSLKGKRFRIDYSMFLLGGFWI